MQNVLDLLQAAPLLTLFAVTLLGLVVGSFLNVVIHRLPLMMQAEWRCQCRELLELSPEETAPLSLAQPASRCPHCGHEIRAWENIPVISYVFLRGCCSACAKSISPRYPIIELLTGLLSLCCFLVLGITTQAIAALPLVWALVALTMIDFDTQLLPDSITLPLLWLGLILNSFSVFTSLESALWGAVFGYMSLWTIYQTFKLLTGKEGMGFGDFKLLAALGAWLGWQMLPVIILLSSFVGAIIGILLIVLLRQDHSIPIPFGPYLAIAGLIALFFGQPLVDFYSITMMGR